MKKKGAIVAALVILAAGAGLWWIGRAAAPDLGRCVVADYPPRIHPKYADVVIPPNIAPLNFVIDEPGKCFYVRITGEKSGCVKVASRNPSIRIPIAKWKDLLEKNRGSTLRVDVCVRRKDGRWVRFQTITNRVATEEIDKVVTYRILSPGYFWFDRSPDMWIAQRDIESFRESIVVHSDRLKKGSCMNCHVCAGNRVSTMVMQLRGQLGTSMLVMRYGRLKKVNTRPIGKRMRPSFVSIHPGEGVMAFVQVDIGLFNRSVDEPREEFEFAADIGLYRFDTDAFSTTPKISSPDYAETYPAWSADGKHLYFCRTKIQWPVGQAEKKLPKDYKQVRYDIMRIAYDAKSDQWGELETVVSAEKLGRSTAQPSISPDGRFVAFCALDYGMWPIMRPASDLFLLDMKTGECGPMACNSDRQESGHCWSSNGRWLVFASKRKDGLFTRLYFTHVDEHGRSSKAVELPQKDPAAHDRFLKAYNFPQFMTESMPYSEKELVRAMSVDLEAKSAEKKGAVPTFAY